MRARLRLAWAAAMGTGLSILWAYSTTPGMLDLSAGALIGIGLLQDKLSFFKLTASLNGGVMNGIEVGQEYYVRRAQAATIGPVGRNNPVTVRTTGWVKVWAVDPKMSLVTVSHACDSIEIGDKTWGRQSPGPWLEKKTSTRTRRLGKEADVFPGQAKNIKKLMGL